MQIFPSELAYRKQEDDGKKDVVRKHVSIMGIFVKICGIVK